MGEHINLKIGKIWAKHTFDCMWVHCICKSTQTIILMRQKSGLKTKWREYASTINYGETSIWVLQYEM